jgi:hypothetical protein
MKGASMSIDCHARVFQTLNDLCGHQSQEVHWKYIQKNTTRPGRRQAPFRSGDNTWARLRDDIRLRVGRFGRLDHTLDGEDYCVQYVPLGTATGERG